MNKLILYIAMSLDGYIADQDGGVEWLAGDGSEPEAEGSYPAFYESVDVVLLGYKTYDQIINQLAVDAWPYQGKECYVLTHRNDREDIVTADKQIYFRSQSVADLLATLDSKRIWLCGGAQLAQQALECDLIDEYRLSMIPCILGGGISLFSPRTSSSLLRLCSLSQANGIAELCYERRR